MSRIPFDKQIGINVDIFPLCSCEYGDPRIKEFRKLKSRYGFIYTGNASNTQWKNLIKRLLRLLDIHNANYYLQRQMDIAMKIKGKSCMANLFGRYGNKEIMPIDYFGEPVRCEFEGITLNGVANYDSYLKNLYGDYMQLPPKEQQTAHINNAYKK